MNNSDKNYDDIPDDHVVVESLSSGPVVLAPDGSQTPLEEFRAGVQVEAAIEDDAWLDEETRQRAIEEDWHRLRNIDSDWRYFQRVVARVVVVLAVLFAIVTLVGCDTRPMRCARWDATVKGLEMCAADPDCRMSRYKYEHLVEARVERIKWCPKENL